MKTVLVFEESSRVDFGGGQKITLITCHLIKEIFCLKFIDFTDQSKFSTILNEEFADCQKINIGHFNAKSNSHFLSWIKAVWQMFYFFKKDIKLISKDLEPQSTISYVTNKRSLPYAYYLNKKYGIPFIYHAHLVERPNSLYFQLFKKWVKKAFTILCVSQEVLQSIHLPQCQILYNPTLNDKGYKGEKKDNHYVVAYIGGLIPIKGVEYFVDASILCPNYVEFRIYGDGSMRKKLKERAGGRVVFKGFSNDVIGECYRDIDIVVLPTVIKEALPLVIVDAKSVGLPVIVTQPGGQAEIVTHGVDGYHVRVRNAFEIADSVMKLVNDRLLYNTMSKESYLSSHLFSYDNYKECILSIFHNI